MAVESQGCQAAPHCRRHPEETALYQLVQRHLETYLALAREDDGEGSRVSAYVEREFRRYLEYGILADGFARARCSDCGHDCLVAFSCKGRGLCPSCNASLRALARSISVSRDPKQLQSLDLQRHHVLQQLIGRIFSGDSAALVATPSAETLRRLHDEVARARRGADRDAEVAAVLNLNTAVLDAAFARLLEHLSKLWSSFAPASAFDRAFADFRQRTSFDQAPFEQAANGIKAMPAAERSPSQVALLNAYKTYEQRSDSYDALITALHTFVTKAAGGDTLLRILLVLFALGMAGRILLLQVPDTGPVNVLAILVVLVVVWAVLRLIDNVVMVYSGHLRERHPNLRGELVNFISSMARIAVIIITAFYLLHDLGYDITTLLASLGIGGLAVAFAAKETIANAFDSHGVKQTLLVYLDELGESSINIMVYCFSKSVNWQEWLEVKQDVIFRCCDIVARNGLSIAFPSRTLYLRGDGRDRDQPS
jgi:small-conductance mechanosensitive channel